MQLRDARVFSNAQKEPAERAVVQAITVIVTLLHVPLRFSACVACTQIKHVYVVDKPSRVKKNALNAVLASGMCMDRRPCDPFMLAR